VYNRRVLYLLAAALLTSPIPPPVCGWYSKAEHRCRDADIEVIGAWDPRPSPDEWPHSSYYKPAEWGAYPTEKPPAHASCLTE
jgi:hypothetical protein